MYIYIYIYIYSSTPIDSWHIPRLFPGVLTVLIPFRSGGHGSSSDKNMDLSVRIVTEAQPRDPNKFDTWSISW